MEIKIALFIEKTERSENWLGDEGSSKDTLIKHWVWCQDGGAVWEHLKEQVPSSHSPPSGRKVYLEDKTV